MKLVKHLGAILAARALALLTFIALALLGAGIAVKTDVATAAIVLGVVLLLDMELSSLTQRPSK